MYRSLYGQMAEETSANVRDNERRAFGRCAELLQAAQEAGSDSPQSVEALVFVTRLWTILMEDLASPDNGLPDKLKASLISIGIWSLRQAEDIRQGRSQDFQSLIDITCSIRDGLGRA